MEILAPPMEVHRRHHQVGRCVFLPNVRKIMRKVAISRSCGVSGSFGEGSDKQERDGMVSSVEVDGIPRIDGRQKLYQEKLVGKNQH